jgi:hypothetical protein
MGMTWEEELNSMKTGIVVAAVNLCRCRRGYVDGEDLAFPKEYAEELIKRVEAFEKRCVENTLSK